jgi:hypothetical protein
MLEKIEFKACSRRAVQVAAQLWFDALGYGAVSDIGAKRVEAKISAMAFG